MSGTPEPPPPPSEPESPPAGSPPTQQEYTPSAGGWKPAWAEAGSELADAGPEPSSEPSMAKAEGPDAVEWSPGANRKTGWARWKPWALVLALVGGAAGLIVYAAVDERGPCESQRVDRAACERRHREVEAAVERAKRDAAALESGAGGVGDLETPSAGREIPDGFPVEFPFPKGSDIVAVTGDAERGFTAVYSIDGDPTEDIEADLDELGWTIAEGVKVEQAGTLKTVTIEAFGHEWQAGITFAVVPNVKITVTATVMKP